VIVDTIPCLVAILTAAGDVDVVNHELVEYCGQPLEAMRQWGTNGTVHSDDLPRVGQVFTQAIMAGDPYDFEARIRRFDGIYRWCQVRGLPLRDTNGRIVVSGLLNKHVGDNGRAPRTAPRSATLTSAAVPPTGRASVNSCSSIRASSNR
jgi:PAS domain S-box-containing protein